jgi:hypothetical protein
MSGSMDLPTASPSVYSEIDVVLDDGTLQKRTVSLSTIPCSDDDVMDQQRQETEEPEEMDSQERIHPHQIHGPMDSLAQRLEKNR